MAIGTEGVTVGASLLGISDTPVGSEIVAMDEGMSEEKSCRFCLSEAVRVGRGGRPVKLGSEKVKLGRSGGSGRSSSLLTSGPPVGRGRRDGMPVRLGIEMLRLGMLRLGRPVGRAECSCLGFTSGPPVGSGGREK